MAEELLLIVEPVKPGRYRVLLGDEVILKSARLPFFGGCRELMRRGIDPEIRVAFRHRDSEIISMRSTVGKAAGLTVEEDSKGIRFAPFREFEFDR